MAKACTINGCGRDASKGADGLCGMHTQRVKRTGTPGDAGYQRDPNRTLEDRIHSRLYTNTATGCWEWTGALRNGYGAVGVDRKVIYVHRWMYEDQRGPIREGMVIDHTCLNRACANPEHLDVVTRAENNARGGLYSGARRAS